MPNSKTSPSDEGDKSAKRSLPSWMTSKHKGCPGNGKKTAGSGEDEDNGENERPEQAKGLDGELASSTLAKKSETSRKPSSSSLDTLQFSKFLEGVVFVLSGFVNPERSTLRSQALEMGAEYQPDWNSDCTLLICAFPNTPKFQQVEANNGTIVGKEWITECYTQRKLVDIESYLMHAGKPWRRSISEKSGRGSEISPSRSYCKHVEKRSQSRQSTAASSKKASSNVTEDSLIPSKVKSWAVIDLNRTTTWLESQEEKPPADEIKKIAAEGILTCLQDAVDALEQNQDVQRIGEQWNIVPRVVEELIKLEGSGNTATSISNADLHRKAVDCKQIYEAEYSHLEYEASMKRKKPNTDDQKSKGKKEAISADAAAGYESDETIEMTEEEIELAYNTMAAKVPEF